MGDLKIAVVGLNHGSQLARRLAQIPATRLVAVCAPETAHNLALARALDAPCFHSVHSMLQGICIDAVLLASPTYTLVEAAVACSRAGKHLLIEKPMAPRASEALRVAHHVTRSGIVAVVGYHRRFSKQVQRLKSLLTSGALGSVCCANVIWAVRKPADYHQKIWRGSQELGGGCLCINLVHEIDLLQYLLGPITRVSAFTQSSCGLDVERTFTLSLEVDRRILVSVVATDVSPSPYSFESSANCNRVYPQYPVDCYTFFLTGGSISFPSLTVRHQDPTRSWLDPLDEPPSEPVEVDDPLSTELNAFVKTLRDGTTFDFATVAEGVRTLQVVDAIRLSTATGEVVEVPVCEDIHTSRIA